MDRGSLKDIPNDNAAVGLTIAPNDGSSSTKTKKVIDFDGDDDVNPKPLPKTRFLITTRA